MAIRAALNSGESIKKIAQDFHLSVTWTKHLAHPPSVLRRGQEEAKRFRNEEIVRRVLAGEKSKRLAYEYGISVYHLYKIVAAYGEWQFVFYDADDSRRVQGIEEEARVVV